LCIHPGPSAARGRGSRSVSGCPAYLGKPDQDQPGVYDASDKHSDQGRHEEVDAVVVTENEDDGGDEKQYAADQVELVAWSSLATALWLEWPARWSSTIDTLVKTKASRRYSAPSTHEGWSGIASIPEARSPASSNARVWADRFCNSLDREIASTRSDTRRTTIRAKLRTTSITTAKSAQPLNAFHPSRQLKVQAVS
jgi:hypothetical protein